MDRNVQRTVLLNLAVLLGGGLACIWAAGRTHSLAGAVALWYFVFAFVVGLVSWFQQRLHDRERLEQLEFDELTRSKSASSLFNSEDAGSFPARQSRLQFEKWFVPAFSALLVLGQAWAVWQQWITVGGSAKSLTAAPLGMAVYATVFLALTIFGLYASRLAQHGNYQLLRPAAGLVLLNAYLCGLVAAGLFGVEVGKFRNLDLYLARLLIVVLGLITIEMAVTLLFEVYRPRVRGRGAQHLLYESRIVGLLSRPDSLFTTAAQALDYQFGFKVSETWFYQFLQRSIAWIVLVQAGLLWLSTTIVFIDPGEQGLRERFGKEGEVLGPGLHFKAPWPMATIHKYRTSQVQSFIVGVVPDDEEKILSEYETDVIQWSVSHYKEEFNMLVAPRSFGAGAQADELRVPAHLLTVSIPVNFEIKNLKDWVYKHQEPARLLEAIAYREVVHYLVNVDLVGIMGAGRGRAIAELKRRMQAGADAAGLGVNILFVGLQDIHPPTGVAGAFQEVIGAQIAKHTRILDAEGYAAFTVPAANAQATNLVVAAQTYLVTTTNAAAGQAAQFRQRAVAFRKSPEVYAQRAYLDTFSRAITNARIYLLAITNTDQVIQFNLEDKIRSDISDILVK